MRTHLFALCFLIGFSLPTTLGAFQPNAGDTTYVRFTTSVGNIDVQLYSVESPQNVANFLAYVDNGTFTNVILNRSAANFVIQAGGFSLVSNSININTANAAVVGEHTDLTKPNNVRGTIALALSNGPSSGTNQWFFNENDNTGLDDASDGGPFTVFGGVANASSLAVLDALSAVQAYNQTVFFNELFGQADNAAFGTNFQSMPLLNYSSGNPMIQNLILISVSRLPVQTFSTWQSAKFTSTQLSNPTFIAPAATPFNDGIPNLVKYALDINPSQPISAADRAKLPVITSAAVSGTTTYTFTFHKYAQLIDASVNVQSSTDLVAWTTLPSTSVVQNGTDSSSDPIMQVSLTGTQLATAGGKQYFRINVTQP